MTKTCKLLAAASMLLLSAACVRRPLEYLPYETVRVIVDCIYEDDAYPVGEKPTGMTLYFFRDGKLYNTATAREVGLDAGGDGFAHWCERLYCKKTGEYFLHGEGGPMTQYRRDLSDNSWTSGEVIAPMTYAEAKAWTEEHLTAEEYEAEFGPVPEGDGDEKTALTLYVSQATAERLRRAARESAQTLSALVEALIDKELRG